MIGEAGEGIAESLMAELIFEGTLFGNVHKNDFATTELAMLVEDVASAEPGFQDGAILAFPFAFDGLEGGRAVEDFGERTRMAETENDVGGAIGGEEFVPGIVAKHGGEGLIDIEKNTLGIAVANTVRRIVEEGAIECLRVAKSFIDLFEFGTKFLFLEGAANDHGQLRNLLALEVLERAVSGEFGEDLRAWAGRQEDQGALLDSLQKELERLGAFDAGTGIFDDDDVVGGRTTVLRAEGKAGDGIRSDDELSFLERMEAGINRGGIAMNEEDVEGTAAVRRRSAEWAHSRQV